MKVFMKYISKKNPAFDGVELTYSFFHFITGNPSWFCRIWSLHYKPTRYKKSFGESYGKTKFQSYRLALKDLTK